MDVKDIGAIKLQLKVGGRLIAPVEFGHGDQRLVMVSVTASETSQQRGKERDGMEREKRLL